MWQTSKLSSYCCQLHLFLKLFPTVKNLRVRALQLDWLLLYKIDNLLGIEGLLRVCDVTSSALINGSLFSYPIYLVLTSFYVICQIGYLKQNVFIKGKVVMICSIWSNVFACTSRCFCFLFCQLLHTYNLHVLYVNTQHIIMLKAYQTRQ